ncbi:hypothetical protein AK830_g3426 [Neonectria ditissima]|uniref:Uncharacterized protein n=1 Tax=Neonectria ditissima TaxID=78410 RepID=A0A0P7BQH1_9HYPO|nr:hypothetical protein AK830_g3426 [Neonectria ditissima]
MRYEDWDILIFPRGCEVPMKEFKVACHVVHDAEFSQTHGSFGLPTLYCFVPSLVAGTPFQISIHSWSTPAISQFTKSYTEFPGNVKFEARLFVDGHLVAYGLSSYSATFPSHADSSPSGPRLLIGRANGHMSSLTASNSDLEPLRFPVFQQELLHQNHWSPADDLGRIKLVISEGFPRDSLTLPIERVKNIVAFSFQHAPLEVLENASIAWPNPSMWRRAPYTASMPVPTFIADDTKSHAHSPRRRNNGLRGLTDHNMPMIQGTMPEFPATSTRKYPDLSSSMALDAPPGFEGPGPFEDSNFDWLGNMNMGMNDIFSQFPATTSKARRSKTTTDISMPDYPSSGNGGQMAFSGDASFTAASFQPEDDTNSGHLKVPSNTPTTTGQRSPFPIIPHGGGIPADLANSLTHSLLNQTIPFQHHAATAPAPISQPRSRKETRMRKLTPSTFPTSSGSGQSHQEQRIWSQQSNNSSKAATSGSAAGSQTESPKTLTCADLNQRTPSVEKFGSSMANLTGQENVLEVAPSTGSSDKGTKRVRNLTPGSAKTIDEDEPRRHSPCVRLTPFADGSPKTRPSC